MDRETKKISRFDYSEIVSKPNIEQKSSRSWKKEIVIDCKSKEIKDNLKKKQNLTRVRSGS